MTPEDLEYVVAMNTASPSHQVGIDLATGPDRTVYRCSCGFITESLSAMADHFIAHGWTEKEFE